MSKTLDAPTYPNRTVEENKVEEPVVEEVATEEETVMQPETSEQEVETQPEKKKSLWEKFFDEDSDEKELTDEEKKLKEQAIKYFESMTQEMYPYYDGASKIEKDADTKDVYNAFYGDYQKYLATEHAQGNYERVDVSHADLDVARKFTQYPEGEIPEALVVYDTRACHVNNTLTALHKEALSEGQHWELWDCTYTDKDGKPLEFNWDNEQSINDNVQAIQYGLDHGLVQCTLPNGKAFETPQDEYTNNLEYYDSMAQEADKFRANVARQTVDYEKTHDDYIPDYITDPEKRQAFKDETIAYSEGEAARFDKYASSNFRLEVLQKAGLEISASDMNKDNTGAVIAAENQNLLEDNSSKSIETQTFKGLDEVNKYMREDDTKESSEKDMELGD